MLQNLEMFVHICKMYYPFQNVFCGSITFKKCVTVRKEKRTSFTRNCWVNTVLCLAADCKNKVGEGQPLNENGRTRAGGLGFGGVWHLGGAKKHKKTMSRLFGGRGGSQDSLIFLLVLLVVLFFWGPPPNPNPHHSLVHQPNPVYHFFFWSLAHNPPGSPSICISHQV